MNRNFDVLNMTSTPTPTTPARKGVGAAVLFSVLGALCLLVFGYSVCVPPDRLVLLSEGWKKHSDGRPMYYGHWQVKNGDDWTTLKLPGGRDAFGVYSFSYQAIGQVYIKSQKKTYTHKSGTWWKKRVGEYDQVKIVGQPDAKVTVFFIPEIQKPAKTKPKPKPKPKLTAPPLKIILENSYYDNSGHIVYLKEIEVNDVKRWHGLRFTHDDKVGLYCISWAGPGQIEAKGFSGNNPTLARQGQWFEKQYGFQNLKFKVIAKSGFTCTVYYHPNKCIAGG